VNNLAYLKQKMYPGKSTNGSNLDQNSSVQVALSDQDYDNSQSQIPHSTE